MKPVLPLMLLCFLAVFPISLVHAAVSFSINGVSKEGDYFIVDASVSGISSVSAFVQGMFTATSTPNYFGYTWGQNEEWVNYVGQTNKDFILQNFPVILRNQSQKIWVKPNYQDSGYKGPGEYYLKLKRYTGASDNSTGEDAVVTVTLTEPLPTLSPTPTEEPTNTPEPTSTWTPNPTKTPTPTPTPTKKPTIRLSPTASLSATSSMVLGTSTESSLLNPPESTPTTIKNNPKAKIDNKLLFFGSLILVIGSGSWLYFRHRND